MRLNPPELGHLEVKVAVNDEHTFVSITASNAQSREVLEQHLGRLRSLLDDAGLSLADAEVSSEQRGGESTGQTGAEARIMEVGRAADEISAAVPIRVAPRGRVDVFA